MSRGSSEATDIADLVLQIGRAAYADCGSGGLTQAQWIALRYFSRANRFSRNVSGFADFHATTRGTASQTVKSLVDKGYLVRRQSARDGRSVEFDLTASARRMLEEDPLDAVTRAATRLGAAQRAEIESGLRAVLGEVRGEREPIGVCRLCGHLEADGAAGNRCRLLGEPLETRELEELCVRFQERG
jgi:DNA-binding MarR family transcriptional regulator